MAQDATLTQPRCAFRGAHLHSRLVTQPIPFPARLLRRSATLLLPAALLGCHGNRFPIYPVNYHEFAYISDGSSGTVTVLDLVYLRQDRVLQVGRKPTGMAVNPERNEVYAANAGSDSISVIDATRNVVAATIGVQHTPYSLTVSPDGKRAYVANSGSNTVSVIDLDKRRVIAAVGTGEGPGVARVSPDNRTLVVSNRVAGSVSVYSILPSQAHPLQLREAFSGCEGATDIAISSQSNDDLPSGAKAWVACSGSHRVMVVWLGAAPNSYRGTQDAALRNDALLCFLDVGNTPTHIALKPDGGEVFTTNYDSDSISEISTWTNEVLGTYIIGAKPVRAAFTADGTSLWVTNFGADSVSVYDVDDGRMAASVRTGPRPDALTFSMDEHVLLVADTGSADTAVIRTQSVDGQPTLFTMLPAGAQPNDMVVKSFNSSMSFGGQ